MTPTPRFIGFILPGKIANSAFLGAISDLHERWFNRGQGSGPWWVYATGKDAEELLTNRIGNRGLIKLGDGTLRTATARNKQEADILCESIRQLATQQKKDVQISIGAEGEAEVIVREAVREVPVGLTSARLPGLALRLPAGHKWAAFAVSHELDDRVPEGSEAVLLLPVDLGASEETVIKRAAGKVDLDPERAADVVELPKAPKKAPKAPADPDTGTGGCSPDSGGPMVAK